MLELYGDLWELEPTWRRCITTNGAVRKDGACVMGRGCAREATERYPGIEYRLGDKIKLFGNKVFDLGDVFSFPVKHHWRQQADLSLIRSSAEQLMFILNTTYDDENVLLPRPGCGNGNLTWDVVRPAIEDILDDKVAIVTWR